MHYSFIPNIRELEEGDAFVVKRAEWNSSETMVMTVVSAGNYKPVEAVGRDGRTYTTSYGEQKLTGPGGDAWMPLWTLPLPRLGDEGTLDYVHAFRNMEGNDAPAMFHIRELGGPHAVAKLVFTLVGEADDDGFREGPPPYTWSRSGTARIMDQDVHIAAASLPEGCAAGDLVVMPSFRCDYEDGLLVTHEPKRKAAILARAVTEDRLEDFLPFREYREPPKDVFVSVRTNGSAMKLADHLDYEDEAGRAEARTEPDEALVLCYPSDFREGETECHVLSHTGYVFYVTDAPNDQFYGTVLEPGLWVFKNANFWSYTSYEGEHDWGIDGDWRPAVPEDAARFGFEGDSLTAEIIGVLGDCGIEATGDGLAGKWMAMAEAAAAKEKAEALARQP